MSMFDRVERIVASECEVVLEEIKVGLAKITNPTEDDVCNILDDVLEEQYLLEAVDEGYDEVECYACFSIGKRAAERPGNEWLADWMSDLDYGRGDVEDFQDCFPDDFISRLSVIVKPYLE